MGLQRTRTATTTRKQRARCRCQEGHRQRCNVRANGNVSKQVHQLRKEGSKPAAAAARCEEQLSIVGDAKQCGLGRTCKCSTNASHPDTPPAALFSRPPSRQVGKCNSKCRTIARACEQLHEDLDLTDLSAMLVKVRVY